MYNIEYSECYDIVIYDEDGNVLSYEDEDGYIYEARLLVFGDKKKAEKEAKELIKMFKIRDRR